MSSNVDVRQLAIDRDEPSGPGVRRPRRVFSRYIVPACLVVCFLFLMMWALRDVLLPALRVTVIPVHVARAEFQQAGTPLFRAAGWIEPRPTPIAVAALAPGVVERLLVVEDQPVREGEIVALLVAEDAKLAQQAAEADRALRQAEIEVARAVLAAAEIRFEQPLHLEAQLAEAEADLAVAQTRLADLPFQRETAAGRLRFAQSDYEGKSRAADAVAGRILEQSRSELTSAQALVNQLGRQEASLEAERAALAKRRDALQKQRELRTQERGQMEQSRAQLQVAAAALDQADIAVAEAKLRLDRMTVRAPVDGRIDQLWSHPGARLVPGRGADGGRDGTVVVTMYRPESLQARVDVRFDDLPRVRPGQPVIIESAALPGPLEGKVLFLSSRADIQKNTLEVKVSILDPPEVLKPEMLVDVTFLAPRQPADVAAASQEDVIFVPKQLVGSSDTGPFVWVADQTAGVARRTPVETGRRGTHELIEVTQGLNVSSRLITRPLDRLTDGRRIVVEGEDAGFGAGSEASLGEEGGAGLE